VQCNRGEFCWTFQAWQRRTLTGTLACRAGQELLQSLRQKQQSAVSRVQKKISSHVRLIVVIIL
jgi:hypothetical protein